MVEERKSSVGWGLGGVKHRAVPFEDDSDERGIIEFDSKSFLSQEGLLLPHDTLASKAPYKYLLVRKHIWLQPKTTVVCSHTSYEARIRTVIDRIAVR